MPRRVVLIAAVTVDGFIARNNLETINWSKDLSLFKDQTMGWPVIMGSNTYKTIPKTLHGRECFVVTRGDNPKMILSKITKEKCFVIGGGKTYYKFIDHLTHVYVTPHPYIFGDGVPLFDGDGKKGVGLNFIRLIEVDKRNGIFQFQYKIIK